MFLVELSRIIKDFQSLGYSTLQLFFYSRNHWVKVSHMIFIFIFYIFLEICMKSYGSSKLHFTIGFMLVGISYSSKIWFCFDLPIFFPIIFTCASFIEFYHIFWVIHIKHRTKNIQELFSVLTSVNQHNFFLIKSLSIWKVAINCTNIQKNQEKMITILPIIRILYKFKKA